MPHHRQSGFTKIEFLVVTGIIVIMIALLLPATRRVREAAPRAQCVNNMRQIGIALHTAQDTHGHMPPNMGHYGMPGYANLTGTHKSKFMASTQWWLLPFLDSSDLVLRWSGTGLTASWQNEAVPPPKVYLCPSNQSVVINMGMADGVAVSSYMVNQLIFYKPKDPIKVPSSFPDGASTTVLVFEGYGICGGTKRAVWHYPDGASAAVYGPFHDGNDGTEYTSMGAETSGAPIGNPAIQPGTALANRFQFQPSSSAYAPANPSGCLWATAQAMHASGINVLMADASVKLISPDVSQATWSAAITPNAKDPVGPDW